MPHMGKRKMDEKTYTRIKEDIDNGKSNKEIVEYYGLSISTVLRVMGAKTFEEYRANNTERINKFKKESQEKANDQITMDQIPDDKPKDLMGELYRYNQIMDGMKKLKQIIADNWLSWGELFRVYNDDFNYIGRKVEQISKSVKALDEKVDLLLKEWKGPSERQP